MQDPRADVATVRRVLARESAGYAELYDRHAGPLYAYCSSMLGDQERPADALGMTFMIAACRIDELRDWYRLRPWLYALARLECRGRALAGERAGPAGLAAAGAGSALEGVNNIRAPRAEEGDPLVAPEGKPQAAAEGEPLWAAEGEPQVAAEGEPLWAAELGRAAIVTAAMRRLSLDDREAVELCMRHHLVGLDLADVLGMPARRAHAAVTRASARLQRVLGALLVACWGREDCPDLAGMLADWDGRATVLLRRRVRRHIEYCDTCRTRERRELPSGALARLVAEAAQPAPPPALRDETLRVLAVTLGTATEGNLIADLVTQRVGALGSSGFPAPPPGCGNRRTHHP